MNVNYHYIYSIYISDMMTINGHESNLISYVMINKFSESMNNIQ